jgi:hypothetical protein
LERAFQDVLEANVRVDKYAKAECSIHDWIEGTCGERRYSKRNEGGGHQTVLRLSNSTGSMQKLKHTVRTSNDNYHVWVRGLSERNISLQIHTEMCKGADYPELELDRSLLESEPAVNQLSAGRYVIPVPSMCSVGRDQYHVRGRLQHTHEGAEGGSPFLKKYGTLQT